jgi:hypothetical protein
VFESAPRRFHFPNFISEWHIMAGHGRFLGDLLLAQALAGGATVAEAAQQANMSERAAYRWLAKAEFRQRVARIQQAIARRAIGRLSDGMAEAAAALRELLKDGDSAVRLRAARALLDLGPRLRDSVEVEARLVDFEQQRAAEEAGRQA